LIPKEREEGLFLRPDSRGVVAARIPSAFPSFAKKIVCHVEIASDEAPDFDVSISLSRTDTAVTWVNESPRNAIAFSGWKTIKNRFKLNELALSINELSKEKYSITLAVKVPKGSKDQPAFLFFRKLIITW
jgi:hypothetical protein